MAHVEVTGLVGLLDDLEALAGLPDSVVENILNAEADVIVQAQREEIERQWNGPHSMGISAKAIKKDRKIRGLGYGRLYHYINVYPQGERKRGQKSVRNAEIAFINEYGAPGRGIAARPAIAAANAKAEEAAVEAGAKVFDAYLDSKNL